ncbi:MAG TPA: hypothetical protein VFX54_02705, partial [Candidatus Binatia bacterium]|nr:hypothetical protein [Candidatus Binatia bacterium]
MRTRHSLVFVLLIAFGVAACGTTELFGPGSAPRSAPAQSTSTPTPAPLPEYRGPATRPFLMGFTQWPADLNEEGVATARDYAHAHGDIVSVMFIGGIPWSEALDGKPFSKDVQESMSYRPPAGK